jgi:hypothetical protein
MTDIIDRHMAAFKLLERDMATASHVGGLALLAEIWKEDEFFRKEAERVLKSIISTDAYHESVRNRAQELLTEVPQWKSS